MPTYIAFLRAVNVGGRVVKMDRLRRLFEAFGLTNVESYIASGNVSFQSPSRSISALTRKIEKSLHRELGYEVRIFLRTAPELRRIVERKAFPDSTVTPDSAVHVAFLSELPSPAAEKRLAAFESPINTLPK